MIFKSIIHFNIILMTLVIVTTSWGANNDQVTNAATPSGTEIATNSGDTSYDKKWPSIPAKCTVNEAGDMVSIDGNGCLKHNFNRSSQLEPEYTSQDTKNRRGSHPGSPAFQECQKVADAPWTKIQKNGRSEWWRNYWHKFYKKEVEDIQDVESDVKGLLVSTNNSYNLLSSCLPTPAPEALADCGVKVSQYQTALDSFADELDSYTKQIYNSANKTHNEYMNLEGCIAAAAITKDSDWDSEEYLENMPENGLIIKKSLDGEITCKSYGIETQDYVACAEVITKVDALTIGSKGLEVYQQVSFQGFQMEQQQDLQQDAGQDYTKPLEQQKASLLKQASFANQRATLEAAKMGIYFYGLKNMPEAKDVIAKCVADGTDSFTIASYRLDETIQAFRGRVISLRGQIDVPITTGQTLPQYKKFTPVILSNSADGAASSDSESAINRDLKYTRGGPITLSPESKSLIELGRPELKSIEKISKEDLVDTCSRAVNYGEFAFLENQGARQKIKQKMIQAGVNLATYLLQASLLKKQASQVDQALKGVKNFEPIPMTFTGEDLMTTLCAPEGFPDHPDCANLNAEQVYGFADQNFDFGSSGSTEVAKISKDDMGGDGSSDAVADYSKMDVDRGLGSPINAVDKSTGELGPGNVAQFKDGQGGAAGGAAGGASGPLGASAPGGGSSSQSGGQNPGTYTPVKVGYNGGGAKVGYSGGALKSRTKKKEKVKNPFKGLGSKSLNFRGPSAIGTPKSNIFTMISKRYNVVQENKRLHEYKAKK